MIGGRLHTGDVVLDAPTHVPAVWGNGEEVLWSQGEPLILAGPPGVGKTTIAQQLALARAGVAPPDLAVLGYLVTPDPGRRTLYVAADRPRQAVRSMRRMVAPYMRADLADRLLIWQGAFDLDRPEELIPWLLEQGVGTIVLDSIKDVAGDVSDGKVGAAFNRATQAIVAADIEVLSLHHNRKGQDGNRNPRRLDDLYGSQWLAAGAGSVVSLWGEAGDTVVELRHLKQPAETVGPLTVTHDHAHGVSTVSEGADPLAALASMPEGAGAKEIAAAMFGTADPDRNQIQRARRRLDKLAKQGQIDRHGGDSPTAVVTYCVKRVKQSVKQTQELHATDSDGLSKGYAELHGLHGQEENGATPFKGARTSEREAHETERQRALVDAFIAEFDAEEIS